MLSNFEIEALELSIKVAFWAVFFSLPFGILFGWILARFNFPGKLILDGIIHLPLVVPPVVIGYLLLISLGRQGPIGLWLYTNFEITLIFTWKGAAIASALMGFPLMVRAIRLSIEAIDNKLETAARTLGANSIQVFFGITLPLTFPGVIAGTMLSFARSLGEFGATITFVSNIPGQTQTLPLALYSVMQTSGGETGAARLAIISIILAFLALFLSELIARKISKNTNSESI